LNFRGKVFHRFAYSHAYLNFSGSNEIRNKPVKYKRNKFVVQSLLAIGGGAISMLKKTLKYRRAGGSTQDRLNYIESYLDNSIVKDYKFLCDTSLLHLEIFGAYGLDILTLEEVICNIKINYSATCGKWLKHMGFKNKEESTIFVIQMFSYLYNDWISKPDSVLIPIELWEVASRPKLIEISKLEEKANNNQPICRAISVCSEFEQFIGMPLWEPLSKLAKMKFRIAKGPVAIGMRKHSDEWIKMGLELEKFEFTYSGDWSKFDQSIPAFLMDRAIDIMFLCFSREKKKY